MRTISGCQGHLAQFVERGVVLFSDPVRFLEGCAMLLSTTGYFFFLPVPRLPLQRSYWDVPSFCRPDFFFPYHPLCSPSFHVGLFYNPLEMDPFFMNFPGCLYFRPSPFLFFETFWREFVLFFCKPPRVRDVYGKLRNRARSQDRTPLGPSRNCIVILLVVVSLCAFLIFEMLFWVFAVLP